VDANITAEILHQLKQMNVLESLALVKYNYNRVGFSPSTNAYRKVPRDTLRVCMLYLTSEINKYLVKNETDPLKFLEILLVIHECLKMLDKTDVHRT
jgi:hypothetical protein